MAEIEEYKLWLASAMSDAALIQTVEFTHPKWGSSYLANWDTNIDCTLENATVQTFLAARFQFNPVETNDTTEQSTTFAISSVGGLIYGQLRTMSYEERRIPILLTHRLYLSTDLTKTLLVPPPQWTVTSVNVEVNTIVMDVTTQRLRSNRIGLYYTRREFPVLVYL